MKTILISTGVALELMSFAAGLQMEVSEVVDINEVDSFQITHHHAEHGPQRLTADRIGDNLFVVSFVGRREYFEIIHTDGWLSSVGTLFKYLEDALDIEEEFRHGPSHKWVVVDDVDVDSAYMLFLTPEEDTVHTILSSAEIHRLLKVRGFNAYVKSTINDTLDELADPALTKPIPPEQTIESSPTDDSGMFDRFKFGCRKFFGSPFGKVAAGCALIAVVIVGGNALFGKSDVIHEI